MPKTKAITITCANCRKAKFRARFPGQKSGRCGPCLELQRAAQKTAYVKRRARRLTKAENDQLRREERLTCRIGTL